MPRDAPKRERVNIVEAAAILGVSIRSVQRMAILRQLPTAAKVGRFWTFNEAAIRAWIVEQENKTAPHRIVRHQLRREFQVSLCYQRGGHPPDDGKNSSYERVIQDLQAAAKAREKEKRPK